ncbi:hypothetical protein OG21DRAFT_761101 [Imleria badia]|nr:hypothetical protein OG21DRAFT_761101 [Imleria badia]
MHQVLQIQEILRNIFDHCRYPEVTSDLPALARTCRAFKEPALDVLWEKLLDPSPLARCLSEASHYSQVAPDAKKYYSFRKPLTQIEWSILRSYTRRIRYLLDKMDGLDWESVSTFLNPPTTEPLFPNLRHLRAGPLTEIKIKCLLYMPFPSLISLDLFAIKLKYLYSLQGSLESFFKFSPNVRRIRIYPDPDIKFSNFFSSYICRWTNLETVQCCSITFDLDALGHLSHMPLLTRLHCRLSATLPPADPPLFFSNLDDLILSSEFLDSILQFLSRTRLPAIVQFTVYVERCPSKQGFSSFLASVQTSAVSNTLKELRFHEWSDAHWQDGEDVSSVRGFEDLQPCMVFGNLHRLYLHLDHVGLSDSELATLALAWPHLEHLFINGNHGWGMSGGITPNGLLQLLQTCPSLSMISLAIDT